MGPFAWRQHSGPHGMCRNRHIAIGAMHESCQGRIHDARSDASRLGAASNRGRGDPGTAVLVVSGTPLRVSTAVAGPECIGPALGHDSSASARYIL